MFGLFKKKEENTATIEEVVSESKAEVFNYKDSAVEVLEAPAEEKTKVKARSNSKYDDTDIGMLHNQFFGSSEALLVESQNFLKQKAKELKMWEKKSIANKGKVNDLKELGFGNTGQAKQFDDDVKEKVEEIKNARRDIEDKTEVANAVLHFAKRYPAYKFITYNGVKEVCEKYNLVFGKNELFTGFVPKTNLADIKKFWAWRDKTRVGVKLEDRAFDVPNGGDLFKGMYGDKYDTGTFVPFESVRDALSSKEYEEVRDKYPSNYYEGMNDNRSYSKGYAYDWKEHIHKCFSREERDAHKEAGENHSKEGLITHGEFINRLKEKDYSKKDFMERHEKTFDDLCMDEIYIAAPIEDMDMSNHRTYDYEVIPKELEEKMKLIEDPVVFYPVSYGQVVGGLIITAWGDEASDPLVMNVAHN